MEILNKKPRAEEYINLRKISGMGGDKSIKRVETALENTLFHICVYEGNSLVGYGRIVGDGAITYVVSDIMVDKNHQRKGIGKIIMGQIDDYFNKNCNEECFISLLANKPADKLYSQFKFNYLDDSNVGMKRKK